MCGIVAAVSERNIVPILIEGLQRLEYRGYDSAGIAVINKQQQLQRKRTINKVKDLNKQSLELTSKNGIAHTRWATHGSPQINNAHPLIADNRIALVHNGILENHAELKQYCLEKKRHFESDTDTEVILHLLCVTIQENNCDLKTALKKIVNKLKGAYALAIIDKQNPDQIIGIRQGSPLVVSMGFGENLLSSDQTAVSFVSQHYVLMENEDIAVVSNNSVVIEDKKGKIVYDSHKKKNDRPLKISNNDQQIADKGEYRHYMHQEIHQQPQAIIDTLQNCLSENTLLVESFGYQAPEIFKKIKRIQVIACGTSYHAGMVFRYWCEDIIKIPVNVEVASEFRYRNPVIEKNVLFVIISQSGETADNLAALKTIQDLRKTVKTDNSYGHWPVLAISNKADSSLVHEADLTFLTHAGIEVGVASTKAFTTQLIALSLLMIAIGKCKKTLSIENENTIVEGLRKTPKLVENALKQEESIIELSQTIAKSKSVIFLGRGTMYPIALEGALKLKEISYIHAEAFPSGELKHGPLALIDENIPVIVIAPNNQLLNKLKSNLEEVSARGGKIYAFEDINSKLTRKKDIQVISVEKNIGRISSSIIFTIPLQLLAYHVALSLGTDIDQPRNLAKSVTVE